MNLRIAGVFEAVHQRFLNPHLLKMSGSEASFQNVVDDQSQVFGSRHASGEVRQSVQILMIEAIDDKVRDCAVELGEIADHTRIGTDLSADCDLERVVVT